MVQHRRNGPHSFTQVRYERGIARSRASRGVVGGGRPVNLVCCQVFFGLALWWGAVALLWWNEGDAVRSHAALDEARLAVVSVPDATHDAALRGHLVHVVGVTSGEDVSEPDLGLVFPNLARLDRRVETYQWVERASEHRVEEDEDTRIETTYTYHRAWTEGHVDSDAFEYRRGHRNPPPPDALRSETFAAKQVHVGRGFTLGPNLVGRLKASVEVRLIAEDGRTEDGGRGAGDADSVPEIRGAVGGETEKEEEGRTRDEEPEEPEEPEARGGQKYASAPLAVPTDALSVPSKSSLPLGYVAVGGDARRFAPRARAGTETIAPSPRSESVADAVKHPRVGDRRISYSAVPAGGVVSVLAAVGDDGRLEPWRGPRTGRAMCALAETSANAASLLADEGRKTNRRAWCIRLAGFASMSLGAALAVSPFGELAESLRSVPALGWFATAWYSATLVAAVAAAASSALTVAGLSWFWHRPRFGGALLVAAAGMVWLAFAPKRREREAFETARRDGDEDGDGDEGDDGPVPDYSEPRR